MINLQQLADVSFAGPRWTAYDDDDVVRSTEPVRRIQQTVDWNDFGASFGSWRMQLRNRSGRIATKSTTHVHSTAHTTLSTSTD